MNRWRDLALSLSLAIAALAGCIDSGGGAALPRNVTIGAAGGSIIVGSGSLSLTVPAGALSQDVVISVERGQASSLPGWLAVGTPYLFAPAATAFALPSQVAIPYVPAKISPAVGSSEIRVGFRDAAGVVTSLVPTQVAAPSVIADTSSLGTFWVWVPDVVAAASLFPLNQGDVYRYDSGLVLTVERTLVEPNVAPLETAKVTFALAGRTWGIYFDDRDARLAKLGAFETVGSDWQEVFAAPVLLIDDRDALGTVRPASGTYVGYVPFGAPTAAYQGLAETTTEIAERERVTVPLGGFDAVRIPITTRFNDTRPQQGEVRIEFWFAEGVGPVAIRFDNAIPAGLVAATVGGKMVVGG